MSWQTRGERGSLKRAQSYYVTMICDAVASIDNSILIPLSSIGIFASDVFLFILNISCHMLASLSKCLLELFFFVGLSFCRCLMDSFVLGDLGRSHGLVGTGSPVCLSICFFVCLFVGLSVYLSVAV